MNKICPSCKEEKELHEFGNNIRKKDGKQPYCFKCRRIKDNNSYKLLTIRRNKLKKRALNQKEQNRLFRIEYLKSHPCVDCGEDNILTLQFDHIRDKKYNISRMYGHSLEALKKEIQKCEIRCANCHLIKTAERSGKWLKLKHLD